MDYARSLVEHPRWRWERGCVDNFGTAVSGTSRSGNAWFTRDEWDSNPECRPDIENPATKGWLLHMLREATGTQLSTHYDAREEIGDYWYVSGGYSAPTEGEALAAALLAVWGQA